MKNLFLTIFLLSFSNLFALDRFVNPNLSSGNGTTLFTTIASAVTASANGDRILIVPGTYNEPALTLNKSLTLLSQVAGSVINYNGNIIIAGFPGMKLEILGFNLGVYSLTCNPISGGSNTNRSTLNIIDSRFTNLSVDQDNYELNCIHSKISAATTFRFGNFIMSKSNNLYIKDEPNQNLLDQKITIAADTITNYLDYRNDNCIAKIVNNVLNKLVFTKWNTLAIIKNDVNNNNFINNCKLMFPDNAPFWNIRFNNNLFLGSYSFYSGGSPSGSGCPNSGWDGIDCGDCWFGSVWCLSFSNLNSKFPNPNNSGSFEWQYNGIDLPCTVPTGNQPLVLNKIIGPTGTNINSGSPNHEYYDIDLTVNDRGILGGPYSILNYNPSINPSNGKAYIFDLEMPSDLFPGIQVDINAKGYHRN